MRVFQSDPDGTLVRSEWYAPDFGLARWIVHCADREELFELIYFRNDMAGVERGHCPQELLRLLDEAGLNSRALASDDVSPDSRPSDGKRLKLRVQRDVRLSDVRSLR